MAKWLHTGDIHIHDYPNGNVTDEYPSFRLNQFIKLAYELKKLAYENQATRLIISADILYTPSPKPMIQKVAKEFFKILTTHTSPELQDAIDVDFMPGNHDLDYKNLKNKSKMFYYHITDMFEQVNDRRATCRSNGVHILDGKRVHFEAWNPTETVDRLDAEILIGHGMVKDAWFNFIKSEHGIDATGYKRAFIGHIHKRQTIGNIEIPGCPIPHNYGDPDETVVLLYDTEQDVVTDLKLQGNFLRFLTAKSDDEAELLSRENPLAMIKVQPEIQEINFSTEEVVEDGSVGNGFNLLESARSYINEDFQEQSKEVINGILTKAYNLDYATPNLNFKIRRVEIKNFALIQDLVIEDLSANLMKLNIVSGRNGSGKTSLFRFIEYMLIGKLNGKGKDDIITKGEDYFRGYLEVEYAGKVYSIMRQRGWQANAFEFGVNGELFDSGASRDLENELRTYLPFIDYLNLLYVEQESSGIFSYMSDTNKVSFVSQFIGLPIIKAWTEEGNVELAKLNALISSHEDAVKKSEGKIELLSSMINSNPEFVKLDDTEWKTYKDQMEAYIIQGEDAVKKLQAEKVTYQTQEAVVTKIGREIEDTKLEIAQLGEVNEIDYSTELQRLNSLVIDLELDKARYESELEKLKLEAEESRRVIRETLTGIVTSKSNSNGILTSLKSQLKSMQDSGTVCPTCKREYDNANEVQKSIQDLSEKIAKEQLVYNEFEEVHKFTNEKLNAIQTPTDPRIQSTSDEIKSTRTKIDECAKVQASAQEKLNKLNSFKVTLERLNAQYEEACQVDYKGNLDQINSELTAWDTNITDAKSKVKQAENALTAISTTNKEWDENEARKIQLESEKIESTKITKEKQEIEIVRNEIYSYVNKILTESGMLVSSVLKYVAEKLNSDPRIRVETLKELKNGTVKPTLNIRYQNPKTLVYTDYTDLSGGQRLLADILFLNRLIALIGGVGFILLDELFKFFDQDAIYEAMQLLRDLPADNVILILHGDEMIHEADVVVWTNLDGTLGSQYSFENI